MKNFIAQLFGKAIFNKPCYSVEYHQSHWIVLVRNPGNKNWSCLRDHAMSVREYNEFGEEIGKRPAIRPFASYHEAEEWVRKNSSDVEPRLVRRSQSDVIALEHRLGARKRISMNE